MSTPSCMICVKWIPKTPSVEVLHRVRNVVLAVLVDMTHWLHITRFLCTLIVFFLVSSRKGIKSILRPCDFGTINSQPNKSAYYNHIQLARRPNRIRPSIPVVVHTTINIDKRPHSFPSNGSVWYTRYLQSQYCERSIESFFRSHLDHINQYDKSGVLGRFVHRSIPSGHSICA